MIKELKAADMKRLSMRGKSVTATVKSQHGGFGVSQENMTLLYSCANDWEALRPVREQRRRNLRYKNGDQWGDLITDPDNDRKSVREDVFISRNGKVPLKHNFIQQFFRNIHGQLLSNPTQTTVHARTEDDSELSDMLTNTIQAAHELNDITTLDIHALEELLAGGFSVAKIGYQYWSEKNRYDAKITHVNPNRVFFNMDFEDPRMNDIRRIGEIHDYTYTDLVRNFAVAKEDEATLMCLYTDWRGMEDGLDTSRDNLRNLDFFGAASTHNKYRVIEVWEKCGRWVTYCHDYLDGTEEVRTDMTVADIEKINQQRIDMALAQGIEPQSVRTVYAEPKYESFWRVKFLTPTGVCLKEMETPYAHESHPYVICAMPVVDGVIVPVISDLIDIQRYINRLIVMIDFIMANSAKGVLLVPEDCIPDGYGIEDFSKAYVRSNGVILISKRAKGDLPKQISANSTNVGAWEMLKLQMDLMQQISGLSGAVQGQIAHSNTPASLYAQQAQNSMLNYVLVFDRHSGYCKKRDEKLLKVIMQYYTDKRYVDISGRAFSDTAKFYEPEMVRRILDFNLVVSKSTDTPVFRQIIDQTLLDMLKSGLIPLEVYLNNSAMPFADKLRNDINMFNQQAQAGQLDAQSMQDLQAQAQSKADPRSAAMAGKFVGMQ